MKKPVFRAELAAMALIFVGLSAGVQARGRDGKQKWNIALLLIWNRGKWTK